jgi:hypothetical protein
MSWPSEIQDTIEELEAAIAIGRNAVSDGRIKQTTFAVADRIAATTKASRRPCQPSPNRPRLPSR